MTELFTCKNCGSHTLVVTHEYGLDYGRHLETIRRWGILDDDHRVEFEDEEQIEEHIDWDQEPADEPEVVDEEFYVNCEGCDREIEFGWSHPDRGGRIWPAECTDFNSWKSWPEPRYRDSWQAKNWLRFTMPDGSPRP